MGGTKIVAQDTRRTTKTRFKGTGMYPLYVDRREEIGLVYTEATLNSANFLFFNLIFTGNRIVSSKH